jgi:tRNA-dihydrouridine synthase
VVVARGAIGNPWIFRQSKDLIQKGFYDDPDLSERLGHFSTHLELLGKRVGEEQAIRELRKSFAGYTRNMRNGARLRTEYMKCSSMEDVRDFLTVYGNVNSSIR